MFWYGLLLVAGAAFAADVSVVPQNNITVFGLLGAEKPVNLLDLSHRPVIVLAEVEGSPSAAKEHYFTAYYLHYGLRSMKDFRNFQPLIDYFTNSDGTYALSFFPEENASHSIFTKSYVKNMVFQENFNLFELHRALPYPIPVFIVFPKKVFLKHNFQGVVNIGQYYFVDRVTDQSVFLPHVDHIVGTEDNTPRPIPTIALPLYKDTPTKA